MNPAGRHRDALALHEAAADLAAELGDADALAMASPERTGNDISRAYLLINRAELRIEAGRPETFGGLDAALRDAEGGGALAEQLGGRYLAGCDVAEALGRRGALAEARTRIGVVIEEAWRLGVALTLAEVLFCAARLACDRDDRPLAERLLDEIESLLAEDADVLLR